MSKEAIEHYEAALKEAFPSGATGNVFHHWNEARKALAEQPAQQEPVAWMSDRAVGFKRSEFGATPTVPLYTSPQAQRTWVGLTDEEIEQVCVPLGAAMLSFTEVARAIEAKLKERNQ